MMQFLLPSLWGRLPARYSALWRCVCSPGRSSALLPGWSAPTPRTERAALGVIAARCYSLSLAHECLHSINNHINYTSVGRVFLHGARQSWTHARRGLGPPTGAPFRTLVSTAVPKDVLLFEHDRTGFFRLLGLFCAAQLLFWTYLAHFAYTELRDTGLRGTVIMGQDGQNLPKLGGVSLNLGSDRWRYAFTAGCLTVGSVMVSVSLLFSRRCVRSVVLKRGGQQVTVVTHALVGGRSFSVPLSQVTCHAHRSEVAAHIPLRIKGHSLYYLLDRQGRLANPRLFDVTVGAYRTL